MPSPVLSTLHIVSHLVLPTTLGGGYYYDPYFTDGEIEAQIR